MFELHCKCHSFWFDGYKEALPPGSYPVINVGDEQLHLPWKSVATGGSDRLFASPLTDSLLSFAYEGGMPLSATTDGDGYQLWSLNPPGEEDNLLALCQADSTGNAWVAGGVRVKSYPLQRQRLVVVPVGSSQASFTKAQLQTDLNTIYAQAVSEWEVSIDAALPLAGIDDLSQGITVGETDYSEHMRQVWRALVMDRNPVPGATYLFIIPGFKDHPAMTGYMPLKSGYGFLAPLATPRDAAHELGHGAFNLRHTFSNDNPYKVPEGTQNLMDYAEGTELWKYQWDYIHNPEGGWFLWEDIEEGANQKVDTAFFAVLRMNEKAYYFTKRANLSNSIIQKVRDNYNIFASLDFVKWNESENFVDNTNLLFYDNMRFFEIIGSDSLRDRNGNARFVVDSVAIKYGDWDTHKKSIKSSKDVSLEVHLSYPSSGLKKYNLGNMRYSVGAESRPLRVLCLRNGYNNTYYANLQTIGDNDNGEASILQGEELTFVLEEKKEEGEWVTIDNVYWKPNTSEEYIIGSEYKFKVEGVVSFVEAKNEESSIEFRVDLNAERPREALPGVNEFLNVNVDYLDTEKAKTIARDRYAVALKAIQTKNSELYNFISSPDFRFNVIYVRNHHMSDPTTAGLTEKQHVPFMHYHLLSIDHFEFEGIEQSVSLSEVKTGSFKNRVIKNAKLVSRLTPDEEKNIYLATEARNDYLIRPELRSKLVSFNNETFKQLCIMINNGIFDEVIINSIRYEIPREDITRYLGPGFNFTISFNYDHDWVSLEQLSFTRVVAHEFRHTQYYVIDFYDALKWSYIRKECVEGNINLVNFMDREGANGNECEGCSRGAGHEKFNPENCKVCNEENKYQ